VAICLDIKTAYINDIKDPRSLLGDSSVLRSFVGMIICDRSSQCGACHLPAH